MFFGISLTPKGWLYVLIAALFLIFSPMFVIESFANMFPEPVNKIIILAGSYVFMPMLVAWLYKRKFLNSGRGSAIFYIYVGAYAFLFLTFFAKLFSGDAKWDDYLGVVVLGAVVTYLISSAIKTHKEAVRLAQEAYKLQREDDIQRQAEAILLAEEMKKQKEISEK